MTVKMFDSKGECQYCSKPTRAKSTSLCNACYKLDLAIKNNPKAAEKILENYIPKSDAGYYNPYIGPRSSQYYVPESKAYKGTIPKEEQ